MSWPSPAIIEITLDLNAWSERSKKPGFVTTSAL
jgi:hypothetical protein